MWKILLILNLMFLTTLGFSQTITKELASATAYGFNMGLTVTNGTEYTVYVKHYNGISYSNGLSSSVFKGNALETTIFIDKCMEYLSVLEDNKTTINDDMYQIHFSRSVYFGYKFLVFNSYNTIVTSDAKMACLYDFKRIKKLIK